VVENGRWGNAGLVSYGHLQVHLSPQLKCPLDHLRQRFHQSKATLASYYRGIRNNGGTSVYSK
jgi:hypothetical protein